MARDRSAPPPASEDPAGSRRSFLARLAAICGGAIAFVTGGLALTTFVSPVFGRKTAGWVRVGEIDPDSERFPRTVAVSFRRNDGWLTGSARAVVHLTKDDNGDFTALSSICTHLGCGVGWDDKTERFLCPCHGGAYDRTGAVVAGPPPRPLAKLETRFEDGILFVRGEDLGA
jgi:Rieske Fe-S protein